MEGISFLNYTITTDVNLKFQTTSLLHLVVMQIVLLVLIYQRKCLNIFLKVKSPIINYNRYYYNIIYNVSLK